MKSIPGTARISWGELDPDVGFTPSDECCIGATSVQLELGFELFGDAQPLKHLCDVSTADASSGRVSNHNRFGGEQRTLEPFAEPISGFAASERMPRPTPL